MPFALILLGLILTGCVGGFLAGLLGVGGGIIFIPVISHFLGSFYTIESEELVRFTLANSVGLVFLSGVSGIYRQKKLGVLNLKKAFQIGLPGAISAATLNYFIHHGTWYEKSKFQSVFLAFLVLSILNMLFGKKGNDEITPTDNQNWVKESFVGLLAGITVALSGLGGGIIMVPLFRMILKKPMQEATSLSLSIVPILSCLPLFQDIFLSHPPQIFDSSSLSNFKQFLQTGYLVWPMFLPMGVGVLVFSSFGQKTAKKMSVKWLRIIFAVISLLILIKTVYELL